MKCLITGASTGIGLELARQLAEAKYNLVLVARSQDKLHKIKNELEAKYRVRVSVYPMDLSLPASGEVLFDHIKKDKHEIDILINNAGFGYAGSFTTMGLEDLKGMMDLNMNTLTVLTYLFSKEMVAKNSGRILNVASVAAYQPGPLMSVYYATKAYVLSLTEALHQELKDYGVTVSALCPGPTETEFGNRAKVSTKNIKIKDFFSVPAPEVAKKGIEGLLAGKKVIIPGVANNLIVQTNRFMSRSFLASIVKSLHKKAMKQ